MGRQYFHSKLCDWDGESNRLTWKPGKCPACDILKATKITDLLRSRASYGIGKTELHLFCLSGIQWAKCTKHTNPSCACGKPVLNATA